MDAGGVDVECTVEAGDIREFEFCNCEIAFYEGWIGEVVKDRSLCVLRYDVRLDCGRGNKGSRLQLQQRHYNRRKRDPGPGFSLLQQK